MPVIAGEHGEWETEVVEAPNAGGRKAITIRYTPKATAPYQARCPTHRSDSDREFGHAERASLHGLAVWRDTATADETLRGVARKRS
jgi:hypothetical protein